MNHSLRFITALLFTPALTFYHASVKAEIIPETNLSINLETANLIGSGRHLNIHRVPLTNVETDETVLYDLTLEVDLNAEGALVTNIVASEPSLVLDGGNLFIPGVYESGDGKRYVVSGGSQLSDNRFAWNIANEPGQDFTFNASWVTGSPAGHTLIGSLPLAPELPEGPSYGIVGSESFNEWTEGGLMSAIQIGDSITLSAYHTCCPTNQASPTTNFTITRIVPAETTAPPAAAAQ